MSNMKTEILLSGFGGQGLMSLGKIIALAAIYENKYATWFPSYGSEVRGGTAHCLVKLSNTIIGSALIDNPNIAILLNQPSVDKFQKILRKGCLVILNGDLINSEIKLNNVKKNILPLNKIALECGHIRTANIVALGVLLGLKKELVAKATIEKVLREAFTNPVVLDQNIVALNKGINLV